MPQTTEAEKRAARDKNYARWNDQARRSILARQAQKEGVASGWSGESNHGGKRTAGGISSGGQSERMLASAQARRDEMKTAVEASDFASMMLPDTYFANIRTPRAEAAPSGGISSGGQSESNEGRKRTASVNANRKIKQETTFYNPAKKEKAAPSGGISSGWHSESNDGTEEEGAASGWQSESSNGGKRTAAVNASRKIQEHVDETDFYRSARQSRMEAAARASDDDSLRAPYAYRAAPGQSERGERMAASNKPAHETNFYRKAAPEGKLADTPFNEISLTNFIRDFLVSNPGANVDEIAEEFLGSVPKEDIESIFRKLVLIAPAGAYIIPPGSITFRR